MESVEYCLDEILKRLNADRQFPVGERHHLNADIILREVIKTDRHEDFIELMEILKEDGFIKTVNMAPNLSKVDLFRDCLITMQGSFFIENGGYSQKSVDASSENTRLKNLETSRKIQSKVLNWLTCIIAVGTLIAAVYYLTELYWEHHWFR